MSSSENVTNDTVSSQHPPPWVSPPIDAWTTHYWKLFSLFIYYIMCFIVGLCVNWVCLLNINKTNLTPSARYLMVLQCIFNICYIMINFPYKATILFLQKTFLPFELKVFCGWLHLWVVFGSMFLQDVTAITRVIYIIFPHLANEWFSTKKASLFPILFPVTFGCLYSFPSLHPCCYRFYKFTSYSMSYIGYGQQVQLWCSLVGSCVLIATQVISYTAVFMKIKKCSKTVATDTTEQPGQNGHSLKEEIKLTILFAVTGCIWFVYLLIFYIIYWSGLFQPYSLLALANELLEQVLFFVDPVVYILISSELRRCVLKFLGIKVVEASSTSTEASQTKFITTTEKISLKPLGTALSQYRKNHPRLR